MHRVGQGRGNAVQRNLGDGLGPERPAGLVGLHEDDLDVGHVGRAVSVIRPRPRVEQLAARVVDHLLGVGKAQRLLDAALHLPRGRNGIDDPPRVDGHHHPFHGDLAGFDVHHDLDELRGKGRRAFMAHVRSRGHDLMLVVHVQAVQGHFPQGDRAAVGRHHPTLLQHQGLGVVHAQHGGRVGAYLPGHGLRGLAHRAAADVGGAAGISARVERREVGVGRVHDDVVGRDAQHLGRDLGQHRVGAGAQVRGAYQQVEGAIVVHLEERGAHIQAGHAAAVHHHGHANAAAQMRLARHFTPAGVASLGVPVHGLGPHPDAVVQAAGGHRLVHPLAAFAQLAGQVHGLAGLNPVATLELDFVPAHLRGDFGHDAFHAEERLGGAIAAKRARHGLVGVHHIAHEAGVGRVVEGQALEARHHRHGQAVGGIGPRVGDEVQLHRHHPALAGHAHLEAHDVRMSAAAAGELLPAGELQIHRPAGFEGQPGRQIFHHHLLLVAKTAPQAGLDDPDALLGQAQQRGQHTAHMEGRLGAGDDHQPVVFVPVGEGHVRLQVDMLLLAGAVFALEDEIGLGPGRVRVPHLRDHMVHDVALAVVQVGGVGLVVDDGRARLHGLQRVQHMGQHLVLHFDETQGLPRDVGGLRGHHRDPVAHEAHFVVQHHLVVGLGVGVTLPARSVFDARDVAIGQHRVHAG